MHPRGNGYRGNTGLMRHDRKGIHALTASMTAAGVDEGRKPRGQAGETLKVQGGRLEMASG